MSLRNPQKAYDKTRYIGEYRCWYCQNGARRTAGGRPICGHHYSRAAKDYLERHARQ